LSIELREIYKENRGKTGEPRIKTEILEGKQRNQAIKQKNRGNRKNGKKHKTEETEQNRENMVRK